MHIQDLFEDRARKGDGAFAIAFALMELAQAQKATAGALDALGFNGGSSAPGTTEKLAMELARVADALE
jgi:hypothetical protein